MLVKGATGYKVNHVSFGFQWFCCICKSTTAFIKATYFQLGLICLNDAKSPQCNAVQYVISNSTYTNEAHALILSLIKLINAPASNAAEKFATAINHTPLGPLYLYYTTRTGMIVHRYQVDDALMMQLLECKLSTTCATNTLAVGSFLRSI